MTPDERSLLENTHQLAKENNDMLHKLNKRARLGLYMKSLYWVAIIGLSFGAFYFIQPYVDFLRGITGGTDTKSSQNSSTNESGFSEQLRDLLK